MTQAADPPLISVVNLSKSYGTHQVLRSVSLSVQRSEVVCIIGPSGSGKSTLLRCVNNLEPYDAGDVLVSGLKLGSSGSNSAASNRARRRIAMVFQQFNLWPHMTVLQNVTQPLVLVHGKSRAQAEVIGRAVLAKVGLVDKLAAYPAQLSGGQQQRVGIARALAIDPAVILFDEPTSSLDPELVGEVLQVIRALASEGMTMVVVTHEMGFAAQVATRVVFIDHGMIIEEGPPDTLFRAPRSERLRQFLQTWIERNALFPLAAPSKTETIAP
jgi:polar amino acid transport system ATP-binding protein